MSVNLVDLVMKQVGGNLPGILGSLLGESADRTQGAVAGAIPAILGGLMGAASKGGGVADQLAAAVDQQDDGFLDNLSGMLGGGEHQKVADQGSSMLSSILGDGALGAITGAIGKFSGLGGGSTQSLLGMLAPIVMSVLSREQKSQGLDSGGLMNLLSSQKDHIQAAMPADLSSAMGGAGFLDDLMGTAQSATAAVSDAASSAVDNAGQAAGQAAAAVGSAAGAAGDAARQAAGAAGDAVGEGAAVAGRAAESASQAVSDAGAAAAGAAKSGGSMMRWLLPLIILAALLWLAFKFLGGTDVEETANNAGDAVSSAVETATDAASDAATAVTGAASDAVDTATDAASDATAAATGAASSAADAVTGAASSATDLVTAMVGDVDVGSELTSTFDGLTETLSGITDVASAEAALPGLEEMSASLDSLTGLAGQLPEGAVGGVTQMVDSGLGGLDGIMATLEAIPGVGDLVKPIIDQIKDKLSAFTAA